jgi:exodeoxyribonuclease-3
VGTEKYDYKLRWLTHLQSFVKLLLNDHEYVILLGDFNIAPEDRDVHNPEEWEGKVLVSEAERDAFRQLLACGFKDSFRLFEQADNSFSWWDYRAASFRRNRGVRIDHILASIALAEKCLGCSIDKAPRKLERPSDHTPVIAEFDLSQGKNPFA